MKFRDYFSKTFESSDNHYILSLQTHYYRSGYEKIIDAVLNVLKEMQAKEDNVDRDRGEIIVDAANFSGTITVLQSYTLGNSVDIAVLTYNFLPTGKGKKIIEEFYSRLDKHLL
ncbi:MAG: hypothetical protein WCS56_04030 [Bacilli bacterium]